MGNLFTSPESQINRNVEKELKYLREKVEKLEEQENKKETTNQQDIEREVKHNNLNNDLIKQLESLKNINSELVEKLQKAEQENIEKITQEVSEKNKVKLLSKKQVKIFVDNILKKESVNVGVIPDFVEKKIYQNIFNTLISLVDSVLENTKIIIMGHEVTLDLVAKDSK
jgi:hypothetical protein